MMLRKFSYLFLVATLSITTINCASTSKLTPQGKVTLYADEVTRDLGLLQSSSISLNDAHVLSEADTRLVVNYVLASVRTIKQVPNGWRPTLSSGLDNLYEALAPEAQYKLREYFTTIKTVLALVP